MPGDHPTVDFDHPNEYWHRRQLARVLNGVMDGSINSVIDWAFDDGAVILDPRLYPDSMLTFVPLNAAAQAAQAPFVDAADLTDGQATVTGGAAGAQYRISILG